MNLKNFLITNLAFLFNIIIYQTGYADNHNINDILKLIQQDIKTLEKAVYSETKDISNNSFNSSNLDNNTEDVLTRHLLKLSEIENQFQNLTNKF